jgi:hypothetical protein
VTTVQATRAMVMVPKEAMAIKVVRVAMATAPRMRVTTTVIRVMPIIDGAYRVFTARQVPTTLVIVATWARGTSGRNTSSVNMRR